MDDLCVTTSLCPPESCVHSGCVPGAHDTPVVRETIHEVHGVSSCVVEVPRP